MRPRSFVEKKLFFAQAVDCSIHLIYLSIDNNSVDMFSFSIDHLDFRILAKHIYRCRSNVKLFNQNHSSTFLVFCSLCIIATIVSHYCHYSPIHAVMCLNLFLAFFALHVLTPHPTSYTQTHSHRLANSYSDIFLVRIIILYTFSLHQCLHPFQFPSS